MKKQFLYKIFFAVVILTFGACNDPIFYTISLEEEMLEPLIKGSPTNFVEFKGSNTSYNMYVASGDILYRYEGTVNGKGKWKDDIKPGGGNIFALAATTDKLYALCGGTSNKKVLKVSGDGEIWSDVEELLKSNVVINTIYAVNNQLFIGAGSIGNYSILNGNDFTTTLAETDNKMLNGVAYHNGIYYFSTKDLITENGGGIYIINGGDLFSQESASTLGNGAFVGIINIGIGADPVKAINRDGNMFNVTSGGISPIIGTSMGERLATGGLGVWKNDKGERLLLAGRQDTLGTSISSGYTHGYLEAVIDSSGNIGDFDEPGRKEPSTVNYGDNERYGSTIKNHPVNHIFQASVDDILFASTQKNGVWSYRDRKNGWSWNAED